MKPVEALYSAYPFPDIPIGAEGDRLPVVSFGQFAHYYSQHKCLDTPLHILDAGCGTGFSTLKLAQANPGAQITAVDLSQPSLTKAQRRIKEYNCAHNVTFVHADLSQLELAQKFDYIHCTGVLHHLPEPQKGFAALSQHLKPEGVLFLMLYSGRARQRIREVQELLKQLQNDPKNLQEGLVLCHSFLKGLPEQHPYKQDFQHYQKIIQKEFGKAFAQSEAFLVDTYLQVCEWNWSWKDILQHLHNADLHWLRFLDEAQWQPRHFLPALPDYYQKFDTREQQLLVDQLRLGENYAFFAGPTPLLRKTLSLNAHAIPQKAPWVYIEHNELHNGLGQAIPLNPTVADFWQAIDGKTPWKNLWVSLESELEEGFKKLSQHLLEHHFIVTTSDV